MLAPDPGEQRFRQTNGLTLELVGVLLPLSSSLPSAVGLARQGRLLSPRLQPRLRFQLRLRRLSRQHLRRQRRLSLQRHRPYCSSVKGWLTALGFATAASSLIAGCGETHHASSRDNAGAAGEAHVQPTGGDASTGGEASAGAGGLEPGEPIALEDLLEPLLEAVCEKYERCGEALEYERTPGGCVASLRESWKRDLAKLPALLEKGTIYYEPALAHACIEARRSQPCDSAVFPAICEAMLDGTVQEGGSCDEAVECVGLASCGCMGTCVRAAVAGDACDETCWNGARCVEGKCVAPAADGESCRTAEGKYLGCAGSLRCVLDAAGSESACRGLTTAQRGESCGQDSAVQCEKSSACVVTSLVQDMPVQTCVARSRSGGACWAGDQDSCPPGEYCPLAEGEITAKCVPLVEAGKSCSVYYACEVGARCVQNVCLKLGAEGDPCYENIECVDQLCSAGRCARYDACTGDLGSTVPVRHDPPQPTESCPTTTRGELLAGFDSAESVEAFEIKYQHPAASLIDWAETERYSCSGALHLQVTFDEVGQSVFALASPPEGEFWDWTGKSRLHLWVRMAAPGITESQVDLVTVSAVVGVMHPDLVSGQLELGRTDASWLRDFEWHELLVDLPREDLERVDGFGIGVATGQHVEPAQVLEIDVYVDDVWLE